MPYDNGNDDDVSRIMMSIDVNDDDEMVHDVDVLVHARAGVIFVHRSIWPI